MTRSATPFLPSPSATRLLASRRSTHWSAATGTKKDRAYGFTFSDLTQRLLPSIVLDAYPSNAVTPARAVEIATAMVPTPPFQEGSNMTEWSLSGSPGGIA